VASTESAELVTGVSSKDPAVGLRAVASLRALLESVEGLQVVNAREQGWSWQRIAAVLGVSRQAVHQKYAKPRRPGLRRRR
jgi:predicted transcriptional regulator